MAPCGTKLRPVHRVLPKKADKRDRTFFTGQIWLAIKGLCETVGMLMTTPSPGRQVAVVPRTDVTVRLAERPA